MVIAHRTSESNVNCAKNSITVTIRIQLPSGIQMVVMWPCRPFEYRIFLTTNRAFSVQYSDHHLNTRPFGNQTQIYHLKTKLVRYSDGYCTGIQMVEINLVQKSLIFISCLENRTKNHSKWHFRSGTQAMSWIQDQKYLETWVTWSNSRRNNKRDDHCYKSDYILIRLNNIIYAIVLWLVNNN